MKQLINKILKETLSKELNLTNGSELLEVIETYNNEIDKDLNGINYEYMFTDSGKYQYYDVTRVNISLSKNNAIEFANKYYVETFYGEVENDVTSTFIKEDVSKWDCDEVEMQVYFDNNTFDLIDLVEQLKEMSLKTNDSITLSFDENELIINNGQVDFDNFTIHFINDHQDLLLISLLQVALYCKNHDLDSLKEYGFKVVYNSPVEYVKHIGNTHLELRDLLNISTGKELFDYITENYKLFDKDASDWDYIRCRYSDSLDPSTYNIIIPAKYAIQLTEKYEYCNAYYEGEEEYSYEEFDELVKKEGYCTCPVVSSCGFKNLENQFDLLDLVNSMKEFNKGEDIQVIPEGIENSYEMEESCICIQNGKARVEGNLVFESNITEEKGNGVFVSLLRIAYRCYNHTIKELEEFYLN